MKNPNGMMLWTDSYLMDTRHLTTIEHGAYLLLLMAMWRNGDWLPDDDRRLAIMARLTLRRWRDMAPTIRAFFFELEPGKLSQKRLAQEAAHARDRVQKNRAAGALGQKAKALKNQKAASANGKSNGIQTQDSRLKTEERIERTLPKRETALAESHGTLGAPAPRRSFSEWDYLSTDEHVHFSAAEIEEMNSTHAGINDIRAAIRNADRTLKEQGSQPGRRKVAVLHWLTQLHEKGLERRRLVQSKEEMKAATEAKRAEKKKRHWGPAM